MMELKKKKKKGEEGARNVNGFHQATPPFTNVFWKSRKRAGILDMKKENILVKSKEKQEVSCVAEKPHDSLCKYMQQDPNNLSILPEKRKALYEPLDPIANNNGKHPNAESFLPPPDFESTSYPRGWLIGKKRKLVNVDVVESMRRIAIQEMNRKDREIDGLNEQLDEDARCLEHLQLQLLEERSKRAEVERQNAMLQNQITMLVDMLQENEHMDDEGNDQGL